MIVRITGGIGNQMFQYALKLKLDEVSKVENQIDIRFYQNSNIHNGYELKKVFGINAAEYNGSIKAMSDQFRMLYKVCFRMGVHYIKALNHFTEIRTCFCPDVLSFNNDGYYIDGYWQSKDYFQGIEKTVRETFKFPEFTEPENLELKKTLDSEQSVSLHVRRGDYIGASRFIALGKTNYYQKAIEYVNSKIENPTYIVLSDDISWCKDNLQLPANSIYVTWNCGEKSYRDMQIMSFCKHNIIANSSFSWWGAWLNNYPHKIVVAPSRFFNGKIEDDTHIIPSEWTKIEL